MESKIDETIDYLIRLNTKDNDFIYRFKTQNQETLFNLALTKFNKQNKNNDYIKSVDVRLISDLPEELQNHPDLITQLLSTLV